MRIGIDFRAALLGRAGIGRYTREICRAMAPQLRAGEELVLFGSSLKEPRMGEEELRFFLEHPSIRWVRSRFPNRLFNVLSAFSPLSIESFTGSLDLFHYTDFVYPALRRGTKRTLIVYDLLFMHPEAEFHSDTFCRNLEKRVRNVMKNAAAILVPSTSVQEDFTRFFPEAGERVKMIPLGSDHLVSQAGHQSLAENQRLPEDQTQAGNHSPVEIPVSEGDAKPYFLSVGTREPRKNRLRLLKAFESMTNESSMANESAEIELVVLGRHGWMDQAFEEALASSAVRHRVRVLDDADDKTLTSLYENALALVYPSLGEGFGLPVAEAMALGCPVITSDISSLPQVAGDAARLVDPLDHDALAAAMQEFASDPGLRRSHAEAGNKRARELTWKRAAAETLDLFRAVVTSDNRD